MRTVYDIHDKDGNVAVFDFHDKESAEGEAEDRNRWVQHRAPHTVVERHVAEPEDTDELLRLRALVDDLRDLLAEGIDGDTVHALLKEHAPDLRDMRGILADGGES